jgi:hypothetical protein
MLLLAAARQKIASQSTLQRTAAKKGFIMDQQVLPHFKLNYSAHQSAVQLVALVSPTWPPCLFGARVVQNIFQELNTPLLRGHLVWTPMLPADTLSAASAQGALFQDERITQYWDSERVLGRMVSRGMKLAVPVAWDIYLLYPPGAKWQDIIGLPAPRFWMHQLDEQGPERLLNPEMLMTEVKLAIEAAARGEFCDAWLLLLSNRSGKGSLWDKSTR